MCHSEGTEISDSKRRASASQRSPEELELPLGTEHQNGRQLAWQEAQQIEPTERGRQLIGQIPVMLASSECGKRQEAERPAACGPNGDRGRLRQKKRTRARRRTACWGSHTHWLPRGGSEPD